MPELPEVETIRQDLREKIIGQRIAGVFVYARKSVRGRNFEKTLKGLSIRQISRIGKLLILSLSGLGKRYLLIHLKMTGQLVYAGGRSMIVGGHSYGHKMDLPNAYTRVAISFTNGGQLFFNDLRRFGYLRIAGQAEIDKIKSGFGIEPLTEKFIFDDFRKILKSRQAPIKAVLLNQKLVAGIGNIYADEILFKASVRPDRHAAGLDQKETKAIFKASLEILKKAIEHRGTTVSDYLDANGRQGGYMKFLKVYGRREGERCFRCGGAIKKIKVAGRGTRFCGGCQR